MPDWLSLAPRGGCSLPGGSRLEARPPILIDSKFDWEVLEPTSYPCPIYLIIGAEVKGSNVFLVLLGARVGTQNAMRIGCFSTLVPNPGSPCPHLLQTLQDGP